MFPPRAAMSYLRYQIQEQAKNAGQYPQRFVYKICFSAIMARQEIRTILSKVFVPDLASEKKSDLTNEKKEDKIQKMSA